MSPFEHFVSAIRQHQPRTAVVLGSGLGAVPHRLQQLAAVPFADVPGLAAPSVVGHPGVIALGMCASRPLLVFRGRPHYYEGHTADDLSASVRLIADWGVRVVVLTNAAGGIHADLWPGDLMVIRDHLFLQAPNAWKSVSRPRTPPYSPRLFELARSIERERGRTLLAGAYAAVTGPCYETPAEIRALAAMGTDAVGMSTAIEADAAARLGLEVMALSCITNKAAGLASGSLDHREVLANASRPAERVSDLLESLLLRMDLQ
jgi:purine-nucleoside phosphorylase